MSRTAMDIGRPVGISGKRKCISARPSRLVTPSHSVLPPAPSHSTRMGSPAMGSLRRRSSRVSESCQATSRVPAAGAPPRTMTVLGASVPPIRSPTITQAMESPGTTTCRPFFGRDIARRRQRTPSPLARGRQSGTMDPCVGSFGDSASRFGGRMSMPNRKRHFAWKWP